MRVLVITEDFRKDQYILKPLVEAMLRDAGRPRAKVRVCCDPLLGGVAQALRWQPIRKIIDRYRGMIDLFLLFVDRDGVADRRDQLDRLEDEARSILDPASQHFVAENAWQELEVWVLAGTDLPARWSWQDIRSEVQVKERFFEPLVAKRGLGHAPGGGRKRLAEEAARRFDRLRRLCPEDIGMLDCRIRRWLSDPGESAQDTRIACGKQVSRMQE